MLFAGLYWGANSTSSQRTQVLFDTPATATYTTVNGAQIGSTSSATPSGTNYHAFANVTGLVQAGGNGTYTVANVQATTGTNFYAGWSLVVVYRAPGEPARNLTVFDGYAVINIGDPPLNIPISGFAAPPAGPVNAKIGVVGYEGDLGRTGDNIRLNGANLSDSQNPSNNFFNSSISNLGSRVTTKAPDFVNQLGFDADIVQAPAGAIPNGATTATVTLGTSLDVYFAGLVTTAIDLFAPQIAHHQGRHRPGRRRRGARRHSSVHRHREPTRGATRPATSS